MILWTATDKVLSFTENIALNILGLIVLGILKLPNITRFGKWNGYFQLNNQVLYPPDHMAIRLSKRCNIQS